MSRTVSARSEIAASPEAVWQMVADVTRMGEWSDENTGAVWTRGAAGPQVGARFKGTNKNGRYRWSTQCTVTASEPGEGFAFRVSTAGLPVATWHYGFTPSDVGCNRHRDMDRRAFLCREDCRAGRHRAAPRRGRHPRQHAGDACEPEEGRRSLTGAPDGLASVPPASPPENRTRWA